MAAMCRRARITDSSPPVLRKTTHSPSRWGPDVSHEIRGIPARVFSWGTRYSVGRSACHSVQDGRRNDWHDEAVLLRVRDHQVHQDRQGRRPVSPQCLSGCFWQPTDTRPNSSSERADDHCVQDRRRNDWHDKAVLLCVRDQQIHQDGQSRRPLPTQRTGEGALGFRCVPRHCSSWRGFSSPNRAHHRRFLGHAPNTTTWPATVRRRS